MKELTQQELTLVTGGARKSTIIKSGIRIVAKNVARGFLIGTGVGTALAFAWFIYDAHQYYNA